MARPIAYNASGPLSGSIRGGSVNYTIDGAGRDYTTFAGKKWVPSADGAAPIVFVTDSFTRGLTTAANAYPLFFSCAGTGSAAILYTANRLPGSPGNFTDTGSAFYDLTFSYGYFILESNDPFEGVDADNLALDLDASKISSYPQSSTKWFDISGNVNNSDLINGPAWNSSGWFQFDGVDDYVSAGNLGTIGNNQTIEVWFNSNSVTSYKNVLDMNYSTYSPNTGNVGPRLEQFDSGEMQWVWSGNTTNNAVYNFSAVIPLLSNKWYHTIFTLNSGNYNWYVNGNLVDSGISGKGYITTYGDVNLGRGFVLDPSRYFSGLESSARIYKKTLSEIEVKQNYFGSPIVTDGLVFAVDANNIVSYPKSGTSAYNLTGSNELTLQNGLQYKSGNGGYFLSDGTDDGLTTPDASNLDLNNFTLEGWVWWNQHKNYASLLVKGPGGSGNVFNYCFFFYAGSVVFGFGDGISFYNVGISPPTTNTWHHIVGTYDGTNLKFYLDGVLASSGTAVVTPYQNTYDLNVIQPDYPIDGRVANSRLYNRALTAAEVQQNYQAEQYRFEGPSGPVTNGLVLYWDAGNLDSYPGTGTTIYDLSGNGNNGNVVNGVGYNQTNGGVLTFDGIDDQVYLSTLNLTSTNNTVMGAARYTGTSPHGRMINSLNNNWLLGQWNNSTLNYYAEGTVYGIPGGPDDTNWRIYTGTGDISGDSWGFYVNNSLITQNNAGVQGPNGISIGRQGFGAEWSTGQFSFLLIYNRVLTTAEMTQNYNYFKGRFGL